MAITYVYIYIFHTDPGIACVCNNIMHDCEIHFTSVYTCTLCAVIATYMAVNAHYNAMYYVRRHNINQ